MYSSPKSVSEMVCGNSFQIIQRMVQPWKKFMNLLTSHPKIKRALDEQKILISKEFITIASKEKIRGDAWATEFISLI